jgi:lysophospholipase L1-like esterase
MRHSQTAAPKSGVMLCIGDSLTQGKKYSTDSYPANLDTLLQEAGYNFAVKNEGISAETSDVMLRRLPHALANAGRFGPISFILVMTGTNDLLQYRTPEYILGNLRRIHDAAAAVPGSPCIAALTLPRCRMFTPQQEEMRLIVNAGIKEICKQPAGRPRFLIDLDSVSVELATDGIHYYGAGYKEFAELAMEAMRKLWAEESNNGW